MKFREYLTEGNSSARLDHKIQDLKSRVFIDSYLKDSEKNWLDGDREIKAVSTTIDLNTKTKEIYLNRMDAHRTGKGYGREALEFILKYTKSKGYKSAKGYTEFGAIDSQNMLTKLGFKPGTDQDSGKYFIRKL